MSDYRPNGYQRPVDSSRHQWLLVVVQACDLVIGDARQSTDADATERAEAAEALRDRFQAELDAEPPLL